MAVRRTGLIISITGQLDTGHTKKSAICSFLRWVEQSPTVLLNTTARIVPTTSISTGVSYTRCCHSHREDAKLSPDDTNASENRLTVGGLLLEAPDLLEIFRAQDPRVVRAKVRLDLRLLQKEQKKKNK